MICLEITKVLRSKMPVIAHRHVGDLDIFQEFLEGSTL